MGPWYGWLPRVAALAMTAVSAVSAAPSDESDSTTRPVTASHYVVSTGDAEKPDAQGYRLGCADGRAGAPGLRILFYGTQEQDGRVRPPGTTRSSPAARVPPGWVADHAAGWVRGFTACGHTSAVVALGVNNKSDGRADPGPAGAAWAGLVERVAAAAPADRVRVAGGLDGEPSWSPPSWARAWVDAYVRGTRRALYAANSADGCPADDSAADHCAHGWSLADVYHVSTGAASTVAAVPQIYRTDGVQARQWARISAYGTGSGSGPLRLAGVLTQRAACRTQGGCGRTANSPTDARAQLERALAGGDRTARSGTGAPLPTTDVDWPVPPPPRGDP